MLAIGLSPPEKRFDLAAPLGELKTEALGEKIRFL